MYILSASSVGLEKVGFLSLEILKRQADGNTIEEYSVLEIEKLDFKNEIENDLNNITSLTKLNSNLIAEGLSNGIIEIWTMNGSEWHIYTNFTVHSDSITSMIHIKSINLLVSSSSNGEIKVWNYTANNLIDDELLAVDLYGHVGAVYSIMELDNGLIVSAGADKTIRAWNLSAEVLLDSEIQTNHLDSIIAMTVVKESILVTGSLDTKIKAWNAKSFLVGEELTSINTTGAVYSLVSIKGTVIAFSGADFRIYLWDIETSVLIGTLYGHTNQVFSMLKLVGTPSNKGFYVGSSWIGDEVGC